jgi:beta-glucosidase
MTRNVDELLSRMTLAEKVGQLVLENAFAPVDWMEVGRLRKQADEQGLPFEMPLEFSDTIEERVRGGHVSGTNSADPRINERLQRIALEESRLGIPLLVSQDVLHGFRTVFPIPLAAACSWNPELVQRAARVAAVEASTAGINCTFAPMVDIARDPRWGRIAEGAGEDPFLGGTMAQAQTRGFQSPGLPTGFRIAACPKHYAGYGAAEAGRDYNTVDMSERTLRDVYLPPFKAAFDAGAGSTMSSFNEIGGVPGTCNAFLLRTVLREEWGFAGPVVSDFNAIGELVDHGVARDLKDAVRLSIMAGVDMDLDSGGYTRCLAELVEDGLVPVEVVDAAARRVLQLKLDLGLFDGALATPDLQESHVLTDEHRALALELATQSIVLLKNDRGVLPLEAAATKIALIGPLANNRSDLLGTWVTAGQASDVETVLVGMQAYLGPDGLAFEPGCPLEGMDEVTFSAARASAVAAARAADVVVAVVGEGAGMSGEAHSRAHLGLPGRQQELIDALAATGKPLIVVLVCGRPLVVPELVAQADALLLAWHGGIRGGRALADIIFGAANPSGKLCASWPRAHGQIPVYYAHKPTGRPAEGAGTTQYDVPFRSTYMDEPNAPLFSFGQGLSYTGFAYSDLRVMTPSVRLDGVVRAAVTVRNTGGRAGEEVVQFYVRDLVCSVTRPVKELKGFRRIALAPGEEREVVFEVPVAAFGCHGPDLRYSVEPGRFKVWIGADSLSGLQGEFEVEG